MSGQRLFWFVFAVVWIALAFPYDRGQDRDRSIPAEPYGGCAEAWQAPHSTGAEDCRRLGWTVTSTRSVPPNKKEK